MKITNKTCKFGKGLKGHNVRPRPNDGDEEGDAGEPTPGKEVRLTGIPLTRKQIDFVAGEDFYRRNFDDGAKPAKWLNTFRRVPIPTSFTDCAAELQFGVSARTIELAEAVRVKNIVVKIDEKNDAPSMDCTLQAIFPRKLETLDMESFYGLDITLASLKFGDAEVPEDDKQPQLPMENTDTDGGAKVDKTRVLSPGQAEKEADASRQLSEALRGLEKGDDKKAGKGTSGSRVN